MIMFDGSFKNVENIKFGDILMGPDSKHRFVYETLGGNEEMFKITPNKGEPFVVNKNHILHLTPSCKNDAFKFPINIKVSDYLTLTECAKERFKLNYVNGVDFDLFKEEKLSIPPYVLGLWLGDGTARDPAITGIDDEIISEWNKYGKTIGVSVRKNDIVHTFTQGKLGHRGNPNPFEVLLRNLNLNNNKHIPKEYLHSDRNKRLELIAAYWILMDIIDEDVIVLLIKTNKLPIQCYISVKVLDWQHIKPHLQKDVGIKINIEKEYIII